jgi:hypothetical protein
LTVVVPAGQDPYPIVNDITKMGQKAVKAAGVAQPAGRAAARFGA